MSEIPLDQTPLRDLFSQVKHQVRDLTEHLDQSFLPKLHALDDVTHPQSTGDPRSSQDEVRDITVRNRAADVVESDDFTQQLLHRMRDYLNAIDSALRKRQNAE